MKGFVGVTDNKRVKSSFDLCLISECSSKYEMKGFTPTTESYGVSRGAPPASRIMIGLHFSPRSQE